VSTEVLVVEREAMGELPMKGTWAFRRTDLGMPYRWLERSRAEEDETHLQIIPYLLILDPSGDIWSYRRTGGDGRLLGRASCGVGGHIDREDAGRDLADTIARALARELGEELENAPAGPCRPRCWLYEGCSAVGRVHIGLVHTLLWEGDEAPRPRAGEALSAMGFLSPRAILGDDSFELWSRLAIAALS